jgi:hypothetical protein
VLGAAVPSILQLVLGFFVRVGVRVGVRFRVGVRVRVEGRFGVRLELELG